MRSGAVGLNLTQANHVILMDPCMNKQLEYQAVGRVHRLGQRREVKIYRLACLGTVEERIRQMHLAGEMVSAEGSAGSLREDWVTLSEARYRSLLGLPPKEDAIALPAEVIGDDEDEDGEEDDADDDEEGDETEDDQLPPAKVVKKERFEGIHTAAAFVKLEKSAAKDVAVYDDDDEVFF
eukprot:gene37487-50597_t